MPIKSSVARCIDVSADEAGPRYSICTLVNKPILYQEMLASFVSGGFSPDICEYLFIDNSEKNLSDAYKGINKFLSVATGKYIIICHQDIVLEYDRIDRLDTCIEQMNLFDPNWGLLGNAGGINPGQLVAHVHDYNTKGVKIDHVFPIRVHSLDENFILIRRAANLGASRDLNGFHLYGLDLCLLAHIRGYAAYVIDFYLRHTGEGVMGENFRRCEVVLIEKYSKAFAGRFFKTTCTTLYVSASALRNRLFNTRRILRWVKRYYRKIPATT